MITAPADRCPACAGVDPVQPYSAKQDENEITARYRCPVKPCRARWYVCWDTRSLGEVA